MPKSRSGRLCFALIVCAALLLIGRNLYRRDLNARLIAAVQAENAADVRTLLDRGADVDSVQPGLDRRSALCALELAIRNSRRADATTIACLLIARGALRHATPQTRTEWLESACDNGSVPVMRSLLEQGVNPGLESSNYANPLAHAFTYSLYSEHAGFGVNTPAVFGAKASEEAKREVQDAGVIREMVTLLRRHGARLSPLQAVQISDAAALRESLQAGADASQQDAYGRTALHVAAEQGDLSLMQTLLAHGANVNAAAFKTPLSRAAAVGNLDAVALLLTHGADVNLAGAYFASPLASAAMGKNPAIVRLLLARGANPDNEPGAVYLDTTPLAAAVTNLPELVPELLAHHADVNAANGLALRAALRAHRPDMAAYLLRRGAKCLPPQRRIMMAEAPQTADTPAAPQPIPIITPSTLSEAVIWEPRCVDMLIAAGADIRPDKDSILLTAARSGRVLLFARLIALGANVNAVDAQGNTPLTLAVVYAPQGVEALLAHGANPNVVTQPIRAQQTITRPGQTPLILAAKTGRAEVVRLLLAHGADANAKPSQGHTALHVARAARNADVVRMLEQAGAKAE